MAAIQGQEGTGFFHLSALSLAVTFHVSFCGPGLPLLWEFHPKEGGVAMGLCCLPLSHV